jgi:anti-sigma B factor antagonist
MTEDSGPAGSVQHRPASAGPPAGSAPAGSAPGGSLPAGSAQARFEFLPAGGREPATVRCAGDIDLINVGEFQAALDQAAAVGAITADMTAVTYCDSAAIRALFRVAGRARLTIQVSAAGPINGTMLKISGLDQVATVVTLD